MSSIEVGEGSLRIRLEVEQTRGCGLCAFLAGGDEPHVGGVAVAVPRLRSSGGGLTCDVSQICVPGHKDVLAAASVATALALGTGEVVSVTAGIHVNDATSEDLERVMANVGEAADLWLASHR